MIIMKLDYVFDRLLLFCFVRNSVKNFIIYIFFRNPCWINACLFKFKKHRKWTDIFWEKLGFSHKTQKFSSNLNDNRKHRYHFKLILGHAAFQLLSESTSSLNFSLLLNIFLVTLFRVGFFYPQLSLRYPI